PRSFSFAGGGVMKRFRFARHAGFTLIELLVILAIIGLLLGLILPAVQSAREAARRTTCRNHLHQIGIAFHGHHDTCKQFPPAYTAVRKSILPGFLGVRGNYDDANIHTYAEMILPQLEQGNLYQKINFNYPIFSPVDLTPIGLPNYAANNQQLAGTPISVFLCPSASRKENPHEIVWDDIQGFPITIRSGGIDYGPSNGIQNNS